MDVQLPSRKKPYGTHDVDPSGSYGCPFAGPEPTSASNPIEMKVHGNPVEICNEIAGELQEMATWLSVGNMSAERFRQAVLTLEAAKVSRFGFKLTGQPLRDGGTHFELRFADTQELCASMEFDPATRELSVHHICE